MKDIIDQNQVPKFDLLHYSKPFDNIEKFYFSYLETLQATSLLEDSIKIIEIEVLAYDNNHTYIDVKKAENFKTIKDFNTFFISNPQYFIHDCVIKLEDNIEFSNHDDGEVSITMALESENRLIIENILKENKISYNLIKELVQRPNHYIEINDKSEIVNVFKTFDEYLS